MGGTTKPRMTWKRNLSIGGLAKVCEGQRGSTLSMGGVSYASTSYSDGTKGRPLGWSWSAPSNNEFGIPWKNSAAEKLPPFPTEAEAKATARAYIMMHFK